MLNPKEIRQGGFGAFTARLREQQAARGAAASREALATTPPAPAAPAVTDAVPDLDLSR